MTETSTSRLRCRRRATESSPRTHLITRAAGGSGRPLRNVALLSLLVTLYATHGRLGRAIQPGLAAQASVPPSAQRSLKDGVFTEEQAERGRQVYAMACTYCHRDDLSGNEDGAPPLRGPAFLDRWKDRSISELYFVTMETMPQDEPKSLSVNEYADIVAYLLKRNEAPAGAIELPADMAVLEGIRFTTVPKP